MHGMVRFAGFRWNTADQVETHGMYQHEEYTVLTPSGFSINNCGQKKTKKRLHGFLALG